MRYFSSTVLGCSPVSSISLIVTLIGSRPPLSPSETARAAFTFSLVFKTRSCRFYPLPGVRQALVQVDAHGAVGRSCGATEVMAPMTSVSTESKPERLRRVAPALKVELRTQSATSSKSMSCFETLPIVVRSSENFRFAPPIELPLRKGLQGHALQDPSRNI
jgi:hypothetical protein